MDKFTVEQARRLANITVRDMASRMGLSVTAYLNKEKHVTRFYFDEACLFSEITGIPLSKIFFEQSVTEN